MTDYKALRKAAEEFVSAVDGIRELRAERDRLAQMVERVRAEHRRYGLYELEDSCPDTSDEHREEHHHECADDIGEFYCDQLPVGAVCESCFDACGERREWPCPTIQALDAAPVHAPKINLYTSRQSGKTQQMIDQLLAQADEQGIRVEVIEPVKVADTLPDEREVLANVLDDNSVELHAEEYGYGMFFSMSADELAELILRLTPATETVTTVEEINALPVGSVIREQHGYILERLPDGWFAPALSNSYGGVHMFVPATVLYRPVEQDGDEK